MKKTKLLSLLLVLALLLSSCGASSKSEAAYDYAVESPALGAPMEAVDEETGALNASTTNASSALPESRKWIITVNITAETDDLDVLTAALDKEIEALNGYVEDQSIYNGSTYSSRRSRSASLTIRVPAEDVDRFTDAIGGIANVVRQEKNLEDVTLSYTATESRRKALETEEARLLELMEQAQTMADLLEIEGRLTDVRYELESVTSRLRLYDNQIDYATIYLSIDEVQEYTPAEEPSIFERIADGFGESMEGVLDVAVWLIASSPYLIVYGGLFLVLRWGLRSIRKQFPLRKKKGVKPDNPSES